MAKQGHGMANQVLPVLVADWQMGVLNDPEFAYRTPVAAGQKFAGGSLSYPDDKWYFSTPEGRDVKGTIDAFVTIGAAALPGMAGGFSGVTGLARAGAGEVGVNVGTRVSGASPTFAKSNATLAERILAADRSGSGLKADATHRAASFLSLEQLQAGANFTIRGGDGVVRELLQTPGTMNGKSGIFEYILDPSKGVTHQRFIPGGKITGTPNQKVP
jgi:hypothetical protein